MDFFQHQDQARKSSRRLILLFLLAVVCLIAISTAFVTALLYYFEPQGQARWNALQVAGGSQSEGLSQLINWELVGVIAMLVGTVVALGSGYRLLQLRAGGESIAAALGGRRLQPNSSDPAERKLLNVVEEMAIASGTPVPVVYLLEESAINAFAAGRNSSDAVIGVTRGCMELLDRDQLQGVVAHEFSHILHGDMGLNLRLLGLLHGILVIGLLGSILLRSSSYGGRYRLHGIRRREKNSSALALLGFGLMVIGYAGTFFGKLIKAAVSRQREFLADAAAVQFTRNPQGISEALQKLGGYGSQLAHPQAEEFSHMYFGAGIRSAFGSMLATHPPLAARIKRITPAWNGQFIAAQVAPAGGSIQTAASSIQSAAVSPMAEVSATAHSAASDTADATGQALRHTGNPGPEHLDQAALTLSQLPANLRAAAREPFSSRAIIYSLLIQPGAPGEQQWQQLQQRAHPAVMRIARQIHRQIEALRATEKLPLFELTIPALRGLSAPQYQVFKTNVVALIKADQQVAVFEWAVYRMLLNALEPRVNPATANTSLRQLDVPIQQLLSTVSRASGANEAAAAAAFSAGMAQLRQANRPRSKLPLLANAQLSLPLLDSALKQLQSLKPLQKPALLKALLSCIEHDQQITSAEYELFRAIADCLDCPLPPLLQDNLWSRTLMALT